MSGARTGSAFRRPGGVYYTRAPNYESITSNHAIHNEEVFLQVCTYSSYRFPPNRSMSLELLDNSSGIYLIVYGMIRSDRLIIRGSYVGILKGFA